MEDRVYRKVTPFTLHAMIKKMEFKNIQTIQRKHYEKIVKNLTTRYCSPDDTREAEKEERETAATGEESTGEEEDAASRSALGLLGSRCSRRGQSVTKMTASDYEEPKEEDQEERMVSQMSRNRWLVATGLVLDRAKMALHNLGDEYQPFCHGEFTFDRDFFKANKNVIVLTSDSKFILSQCPEYRTKEQIEEVIENLNYMGHKTFKEYPKAIQQKLIKIAKYQVVTPQRTIIREGCPAENVYFLIDGSVSIVKRNRNPRKQEYLEKTVILQKGTIFGELDMVNRIQRSATAISLTNVQLLAIERGDLHSVFTKRQSNIGLYDHVNFLKKCKFIACWPIEKLADNLDHCAPYFFKRNTLMVEDIKYTEWIFIIRSGVCRVIRKLWKPMWRSAKQCELTGHIAATNTQEKQCDVFRERFSIFYPFDSKTSPIFSGKTSSRKTVLRSKGTVAKNDKLMKRARKKSPSMNRTTGLSLGNRIGFPLANERLECKNHVSTEKQTSGQNDLQSKLQNVLLVDGPQFDDQESDKLEDFGCSAGNEPVYIQIDTLGPYDVFGLDTLVFNKYCDRPCYPGLSLVSGDNEQGVEVVLLSKSVFVEHASEQVAWHVRSMAKSYPDMKVMEQEVERRRLWAIYKKELISEILEKKC